MNKPRLIKRGETPSVPKTKPVAKAITIQKTVNVVKEWLGTRQENTRQSARDAFASLFAHPQEPCTEC